MEHLPDTHRLPRPIYLVTRLHKLIKIQTLHQTHGKDTTIAMVPIKPNVDLVVVSLALCGVGNVKAHGYVGWQTIESATKRLVGSSAFAARLQAL